GIYSKVGTSGILTVSAGNSAVSSVPINLPVDPNNHSISTQIHTPTSPLVFGTNTFSIKYSGDPSYVDSNTLTVVITGVYSTSTALISSNPTVQVGQTVT